MKSSSRVRSLVFFLLSAVVFGFPESVAQPEGRVLLTAPASLDSGGRSAVTVLVDGQAGGALPLRVELVGLDGAAHFLTAGTAPGSRSSRHPFEVPALAPGPYKIRVAVGGGVLETDVTVSAAPAVLIETDKPIYRPSQRIQGRVVLLDRALRPVAGPVEVTFHDGEGIRVERLRLEADEFGVAPFELQLASEVNLGRWRIRASAGTAESVRDLQVEQYTLPRFEAGFELAKTWALVGEPIPGAVTADYFFGKPVQGTVRLTASRWVGVWQPYASLEGVLEAGRWEFQIPPVGFVTGTPQSGGRGAVRIDAEIVDSTGNRQAITDSLEISRAEVVLGVRALSRHVRPGLPFQVLVTASTPSGQPAAADVALTAHFTALDGRVTSVEERRSVAPEFVWALEPPEGASSVELSAVAEVDGIRTEAAIRVAGSYSPSGGFLDLTRIGGQGPARIGQTLAYQVFSTRPGTIYYEVVAGGRTLHSDFTESGTLSFPVTFEMAPKGRVIAYQLTPENEIAADNETFETLLPELGEVKVEFDAGPAVPGQPVTVTLDTGLPGRALLGVSIVDESVLSLGRGRLHLERVFEDLEKRFQEPRAQVIVEEQFGPGLGIPFFAPVPIAGAKSAFDEVGLRTATLGGIVVPEGFLVDPFTPINISPPPFEGSGQTAAPDMPRLRQFFPETWLWSPTLVTDENGRARLTLTAPDSITSWRLAAVATRPDSPGPGITFGEGELTVFQDFFVEPAVPAAVVRGERFSLRVEIFNYLSEPQSVSLELAPGEGFEILTQTGRSTTVPANGATSVEFPVRATRVGEFPVRITAHGRSHSDAVLRQVRVEADGFPVEDVQNGVLRAGGRAVVTAALPPQAVEGSGRAILTLTPSLVGQSIQGVSDLLEMPYGCGEQNMIFLAPDIEVLKYLREIGELSPEIRATAENFVNTGYQRQLTFRTADGGFAAFGGSTGSLWLTAFVLSTFSGAREVRDIDEAVLAGAAAMLARRQLEDGSFADDSFLIHTELAGGAVHHYTRAAYVALALAEYGGAEQASTLGRAAGFLERGLSDPEVRFNAYALSIAAVALQKVQGYESVAELVVGRLEELGIRDEEGLHWEPFPVETTGYAAMALLGSITPRPGLQPALEWLSTRRNFQGGYGSSTQDTVVALRALFAAARRLNRSIDLKVEVRVGDQNLGSIQLSRDNFDLLHQFPIPVGAAVEILASGTGSTNYQLATRYNLPSQGPPPSRDLDLKVVYGADHVDVDEIVDVTVQVSYFGNKTRTAMLIVDVAVPTGFDTVQSSLDALVEKGVIKRVEAAGRKRIFYLDGLAAHQDLTFTFQIRALFPVRAAGLVSQAYDYYDSTIRGFASWDLVEVFGGGIAPVIDSVSDESAPAGARITIRGSGFSEGAPRVFFNGVEATDVEVLDDGTLRVTVPNLAPGDVTVEVVTSGGRVSLQAGAFAVEPLRLLFPIFANADGLDSAGGFNGYAFANFSDRPASLTLRAMGEGEAFGRLATQAPNLTLPPAEQLARLERELFDGGDALDRHGWLEALADNAEVAGLIQFGGPASLDGGPPAHGTAKRFWFTRIHDGAASFSGAPARTLLSVVNPHDESVQLRLTLVEGLSRTALSRTLAPRRSFSGTVGDLFGRRSRLSRAYIEVEVLEGPGAAGFQRIDLNGGRSSVGLAASRGNDGDRLWSAQLAYLQGRLSTSVNLVNTAPQSRVAVLSAIDDSGAEAATTRLDLAPGEQVQRDLEALFPSLFSEPRSVWTGSLRVVSDGAGVIGDVLFYTPGTLESAASLPLQHRTLRRAVFGQFADGVDFFSGLALHNPGAVEAEITVRVRSSDGALRGESDFGLTAGARLSREITEFAPEARGLRSGWVEVQSNLPLVAQQVYGDRSGKTLSAVPPREAP